MFLLLCNVHRHNGEPGNWMTDMTQRAVNEARKLILEESNRTQERKSQSYYGKKSRKERQYKSIKYNLCVRMCT